MIAPHFLDASFQEIQSYVRSRLIPHVQEAIRSLSSEGDIRDNRTRIDLYEALGGDEVVRRLRTALAQFRVNRANPRRAPAARAAEARDLTYENDYTFRRMVYPYVAQVAEQYYLKCQEANERITAPRTVCYAPIMIMQASGAVNPRCGVLITPAVLTFLRGWKYFTDGDAAHRHYVSNAANEATLLHGINAGEPGQSLFVFNYDTAFVGETSDAVNPGNVPFSFGMLFDPVFEFYVHLVRPSNEVTFFIHRRGNAAPFTNDSPLDLTRYQIETTGKGFDNSRETCFLFALRLSGVLSDQEIRDIALSINHQQITFSDIGKVGKTYNVQFHIHMEKNVAVRGAQTCNDTTRHIHLGFDYGHYYIFEILPFSKCYIHNMKLFMERKCFPVMPSVRTVRDASDGQGLRITYYDGGEHTCTSRDLIRSFHNQGLLPAIQPTDLLAIKTSVIPQTFYDLNNLNYCETKLKKMCAKKRVTVLPETVFFMDFETVTDGERHIPYMVSTANHDGHVITMFANRFDTIGDMVREMLTVCASRSDQIIVYCHNLNYDGVFVLPHFEIEKDSIIMLGASRIISFSLIFFVGGRRKTVLMKDSYAMITAPLSRFGKMFGLEIEKEVFPYEWYTKENLDRAFNGQLPRVDEFVMAMEPYRREELFLNLSRLGFIEMGCVKALDYAQYYCERDCLVLCQGMQAFREQLGTVTQYDVFDQYTLPSISFTYLMSRGCFSGCYTLTTTPLLFIRQCVTGGRCMLRRNEKQRVEGKVMDFDAVSLYPSAMARLYTLKGFPKVVDPETQTLDWLLKQDGCFLEIDVLEVPKELDFPLINRQTEKGRHFTNEPGPMFADNITIEDIIKYHRVPMDKIRVIRGYYYNEGKNYRIQTVIREIFDHRLKYKAEGNPIESVYKLIMNSCYGKSILKPVFKTVNVVSAEKLDKMIVDNSANVLCWEPLYDGDSYIVKQSKPFLEATGFPTFGVQVLSMSKRIMTEVMATAQDYEIPIYYTDTDSIHIDADRIEELSRVFRLHYQRELIGKDLGQFHSDFPISPTGRMYHSSLFIGVGKKAYLDVLEDEDGNRSYHARLKGIPEQALVNAAMTFRTDVVEGMRELYDTLLDGEIYEFNLIYDGAVRFVRDKSFAYRTREEFKRRVVFRDAMRDE